MKRSPLHRRTPLASRSANRIHETIERHHVIAQVKARDGERCYAQTVGLAHTCRPPLDPHEIIPRSAWPGGHLVASNVRLVCRSAHEWIGLHPVQAHDEYGLHGWSWERPKEEQ